MSKITLTPAQFAAVNTRGSSVLVSAAAGSGKTRVLTERLMSYVTDPENPVDIDSFLIITYTRAAAAELRGRILEELGKRAAQEPSNRRLRRQNDLCYRADIGTIHSFCTKILRRYAHKISLSPDFRVGDEDLCSSLRQRALTKVLDNAYEHMNSREGFSDLVGTVGFGRDDFRLESTVLKLHERMQSHPYPEKWAEKMLAGLDGGGVSDAGDTLWGRELMDEARTSVGFWSRRLDDIWFALCQNKDENQPLISAYGESILTTMDGLRELLRALDLGWDKARNALPIQFPRFKSLRGYEFEDRKKLLSSARDGCKKAMAELEKIFLESSDTLLSELRDTAPAMAALIELSLNFSHAYEAEKRRADILDFSDLEHFAVALLCDSQTGLPTETALEISRRYTEIMVDEYQDVNAVQELIFRSISREENNIFMVGDVKQSIYRFRLADPGIFLDKLRRYKSDEAAAPGEPRKILLQENFRSDCRILEGCNRIFSNIMSTELGDINYDSEAALIPKSNAPAPSGQVSVTVFETPDQDEDNERPDKLAYEAQRVADMIYTLVDSGETILDGEERRPLRFGDIAVLLHSPGVTGGTFKRALSQRGIPVLSDKGSGFFTSPLVVVMIALLKVIDNPHDDIAITAALSSPIFDFSANELCAIRLADTRSDFYSALTTAAADSQRCSDFLSTLAFFRSVAPDLLVRDLLVLIYERLELPALCAAMKGSDAGATELMLLSELADKYENGGYRGLHGFLSVLERMEQRGDEPQSSAQVSSDAVTIMSIHRSKGLEFPVVFLCNSSRRFNTNDLSSGVLIHSELGVGGKVTDSLRGIEYPSLALRGIRSRLSSELLSEEMRVLYVALTRAKERLYVTCTADDPEGYLEKLSGELESPVSPEILKRSPSFANWLIRSALLDGGESIKLNVVHCGEDDFSKVALSAEAPSPSRSPVTGEALQELSAKLSFQYPYKAAQGLPSKLTATSLPREGDDSEAADLVKKRPGIFRMPDLSGSERPLSGAERGTATHIVMQFIDFGKTLCLEDIQSQIDRIAALGQLSPRQAQAVDKNAILGFFASDIGQRIRNADTVVREQRFSLLCPAEVFFDVPQGENVLLQGVVDCCIEEDGHLTVIDYKTDYVTAETLPELTSHYKNQLKAYAWAMERITKKPVEHCMLCFLRGGLTAQIRPFGE